MPTDRTNLISLDLKIRLETILIDLNFLSKCGDGGSGVALGHRLLPRVPRRRVHIGGWKAGGSRVLVSLLCCGGGGGGGRRRSPLKWNRCSKARPTDRPTDRASALNLSINRWRNKNVDDKQQMD